MFLEECQFQNKQRAAPQAVIPAMLHGVAPAHFHVTECCVAGGAECWTHQWRQQSVCLYSPQPMSLHWEQAALCMLVPPAVLHDKLVGSAGVEQASQMLSRSKGACQMLSKACLQCDSTAAVHVHLAETQPELCDLCPIERCLPHITPQLCPRQLPHDKVQTTCTVELFAVLSPAATGSLINWSCTRSQD